MPRWRTSINTTNKRSGNDHVHVLHAEQWCSTHLLAPEAVERQERTSAAAVVVAVGPITRLNEEKAALKQRCWERLDKGTEKKAVDDGLLLCLNHRANTNNK